MCRIVDEFKISTDNIQNGLKLPDNVMQTGTIMLLRQLAIAALGVSLVGCQTPADVSAYSDYRICRAHILRPPLASSDVLLEADRQVRLRGLDCSKYADAIMRQDESNTRALLQLSQPQQQKPIQTQCWRNGIYVNCTSY